MNDKYYDTLDKSLKKYKDSLGPLDTATSTFGCRHSNPDGCSKCFTEGCAFLREDKMCVCPPKPWSVKYNKLIEQQKQKKSE